MSYEFYKFLHFFSLLALFFSLGALCFYSHKEKGQKKWIMILHGLASFALLVSGFGMIAKLKMPNFPLWVSLKLVIWLLLSFLIPFLLRQKRLKLPVSLLIFTLTGFALWLALFKPFV